MPEPGNNQVATLAAPAPVEIIRMGMDTLQGFEALQRCATLLANSTLVPEVYRLWKVEKNGDRIKNDSAISNCVVCLNMANRMGADPLMVAQNMNVIEGRPSWSSIFIIASINKCGHFSPLRFDISEPGEETEATFKYVEWVDGANGKRRPEDREGKLVVKHQSCRAWAIEKATGTRLDGPLITIQLALDEGWIQKKGSKWRTMPEVMLRYRAASMFGKLYAPELLMGLQSKEELEDIIEGEVIESEPAPHAARPPQRTPKVVNSTGWSIESMEEFDGLMEEAYKLFKDAGYSVEYPAFSDGWLPKRGRSEAAATIADLRAKLATLSNPVPASTPEPVRANADDRIRPVAD